jgi:ankyrin repeat protein
MSTDYITFLHHAVYAGNYFAVELFLKSGLDIDKSDINNVRYSLYFAVENQYLRSDLLLKITEFIRDCKEKVNFHRERIVERLKECFPSDYVSFIFNINLCFLFVFIFQKLAVLPKLKAISL